MPKHKVRVTLVAECTVEMDVECEDGLDPTDLTREERSRAIAEAEPHPQWSIEDVAEAT